MSTFTVVHNGFEYDGINHKKIECVENSNNSNNFLQTSDLSQISVNLSKSKEVSINSICILLGITIPIFDSSSSDRYREDMFSFITSLSSRLARTNFTSFFPDENSEGDSDNEEGCIREDNEIFSMEDKKNSETRNTSGISPPKLSHISEDIMKKFLNSRESMHVNNYEASEKFRITQLITKPRNSERRSSLSETSFSGNTLPVSSKHSKPRKILPKKYTLTEISQMNNSKNDLKSIVLKVISSIPASDLEGRSVFTVANQILNSNKNFGKMRSDLNASIQIETCIENLGKENKIILSKDFKRFGLVKPNFFPNYNVKIENEIFEEIWQSHNMSLSKVTSFRSAVNILVNSCSQLRSIEFEDREAVSIHIIAKFIDDGFLQ